MNETSSRNATASSRRRWACISAATLLLAFSAVSCATTGSPQTESVCRFPSDAEAASLGVLVDRVLAHDAEGRKIDLPPGAYLIRTDEGALEVNWEVLPEGAQPAAQPRLYDAAGWAAGMYCRCWPERCRSAGWDDGP